jgi:hypothetical protein
MAEDIFVKVGGAWKSLLASKLPYSFGTATPSTTDSGFLWYDSNSTPAAPKFWDGSAFQALTSGKILQVVRSTDFGTLRSTTSASYVDVPSASVTITPTKSDSAILLICSANVDSGLTNDAVFFQITDSSDNPISGTEDSALADNAAAANQVLIGYSTPATTSPVTYKLRFKAVSSGTARIQSARTPTQFYAIEVSA